VQLALAAYASAAAPVQVETLHFRGKLPDGQAVAGARIAMPRVRMADASIAAKINDRLFIDVLGAMAPPRPDKTFTPADGVDVSGIAEQKFSVVRNDGRILSVDFAAEGCGAYCEGYTRSYAFDVSSGRFLGADDLFTRDGMRELARRVVAERIRRYRREIAKLNRSLRALEKRGEKEAGELSDLKDRIALNENCIEMIETDAASKSTPPVYSRFELMRYRVAPTTLEVTAERCSNHASRALDDVGDVTLRFAYPELRPYLTPYARGLLLNEPPATPTGGFYGQLLRGRLGGDIAITMLLRPWDGGSVSGVYFYDRVRKPIRLSGSVQDMVLTLTEEEGGGEPKARLVLSVKSDRIVGSWEGARTYPVELAP
jgi:hypothetical protein